MKNQKNGEPQIPPTFDFDYVPTVNQSERNVYCYLHENEMYLHGIRKYIVKK